MRDKEKAAMIAELSDIADSIVLTKPATERAEAAQCLFSLIPLDRLSRAVAIERVADALAAALAMSVSVVCVTGSFYTVGEAFQALGLDPYCAGS
jgi:folylpolyglutamate synthase/dihydropteroate synthase